MRKISHLRGDDESAIDITPLIDVVFIMLIFFIVTASFVKEPGTTVDKPYAVTAIVKPKASILIAIDSVNNVWIDRRKVDVRAIRPTLERLHSENPQGSVVVQADKYSKNELLVAVLDASREAGITDVAVAAEH